ncbi:hypothetical protein JKP88DRAFT_261560 [Tribonema minus]|uniref:Uncharacterized protein n=1 Tax=Tribonema minus TaxID=303371 RepID=A0A835YKV4_9STRA|nr:hypothetical protein JKP88DRAFT_261560 [Tribonema minus]
MLECQEPGGFVRYVGYFGAVFASLAAVARIVRQHVQQQRKIASAANMYIAIALVAFCATWYHLGAFLLSDLTAARAQDPGLTALQYLCSPARPGQPDLFSEAYRQVSLSAAGWWWSARLLRGAFVSALLIQTLAATIGLTPAQNVAVLLLDFGVANSVALCLVLAMAAAAKTPAQRHSAAVDLGYWHKTAAVAACYLLASAAATSLRRQAHSDSAQSFALALGAMHAALLLPAALLPARAVTAAPPRQQAQARLRMVVLWAVVAVPGVVELVRESAALPCGAGKPAGMGVAQCLQGHVAAAWASHCQASISWDYIFTLAAAALYVTAEQLSARRPLRAAAAVAALLSLDVAAALPAYMALRELAACSDAGRRMMALVRRGSAQQQCSAAAMIIQLRNRESARLNLSHRDAGYLHKVSVALNSPGLESAPPTPTLSDTDALLSHKRPASPREIQWDEEAMIRLARSDERHSVHHMYREHRPIRKQPRRSRKVKFSACAPFLCSL